jgi:hypothetical protein
MIHTKSMDIYNIISQLLQQKLALIELMQNFRSENREADSHKKFSHVLQNFRTFTTKIWTCSIEAKIHIRKYKR